MKKLHEVVKGKVVMAGKRRKTRSMWKNALFENGWRVDETCEFWRHELTGQE
jgi:hypothetical protein